MADLRGFDAYEVEPSKNLDVITPGKYLAVITESEMKPNRAGTGEYLQLTFQIIEGPFRGRVLWTRLNLRHPNATAVQIARASTDAAGLDGIAQSPTRDRRAVPQATRHRPDCE